MNEHLFLSGDELYRVVYDPERNFGALQHSTRAGRHGFFYAYGAPEVLWQATDAVPEELRTRGKELAQHLQHMRPLVSVQVDPRGVARALGASSPDALRFGRAVATLAAANVYPFPLPAAAELLRAEDVALVVCEPRGVAQHAHPPTRFAALGLDRPLYGPVTIVARRGEAPVAMSWALAQAIEAAFHPPVTEETVTQCARRVQALREADGALWGDVERADAALWRACRAYDAAHLGDTRAPAQPRPPDAAERLRPYVVMFFREQIEEVRAARGDAESVKGDYGAHLREILAHGELFPELTLLRDVARDAGLWFRWPFRGALEVYDAPPRP